MIFKISNWWYLLIINRLLVLSFERDEICKKSEGIDGHGERTFWKISNGSVQWSTRDCLTNNVCVFHLESEML
jgi:hypothetical protein